MQELVFRSVVRAPVSTIWSHARTLRGINRELAPLHMSGGDELSLDESVPLGVPLLRSLLTVARVVPLDLHTLRLAEVWPGRGFQEDSYSLLQRCWRHRRVIEAVAGGTAITDQLVFEPRFLPRLTARVVHWVFTRRHQKLRADFRTAATSA
jgi:hypothetical protein